MESGLSYARPYCVALITDDGGKTLTVRLYHRLATGTVLWLFTSPDTGF